jgi:BirA family biotin operon repressor/biotin-[acetyl-CoA-carboxylase] ligase
MPQRRPSSVPARAQHLDRLLTLLVENATVILSGTKIAAQLRIPHSTLAEWVDRLRAMGVDIKGYPGSGYQLMKLPDLLTPQALALHLRGEFGSRIHHFYQTTSTMDEAARLAREGAPQGALVVAEEQTAGRGRFGRHWHSEPSSGLYFSVILRPSLPPAEAPVLALMAGVAAAEAIQEAAQLPTDLRWPNDVMVADKKCAGVLMEMTAEPHRIAHVLVGVGINVNHRRFPPELVLEATSLALEAGRTISRLQVLVSVLKRMEHYYNRLLEHGPAEALARFEAISSYARGKRVRVTDAAAELTGVTEGLTPEGVLLLRQDDGSLHKVLAGHVRPA